jgi:hypothetical protein
MAEAKRRDRLARYARRDAAGEFSRAGSIRRRGRNGYPRQILRTGAEHSSASEEGSDGEATHMIRRGRSQAQLVGGQWQLDRHGRYVDDSFDQGLDRRTERGTAKPSLQSVEESDMFKLNGRVDVDHRIVIGRFRWQAEVAKPKLGSSPANERPDHGVPVAQRVTGFERDQPSIRAGRDREPAFDKCVRTGVGAASVSYLSFHAATTALNGQEAPGRRLHHNDHKVVHF